jgi:hypothetical protein
MGMNQVASMSLKQAVAALARCDDLLSLQALRAARDSENAI